MRSETRAASNVVAGHGLDSITTQQLDLGPMKAVDVTSTHTLVVIAPDGSDVTAQVDITPIVGPVPEGIWTALSDDPSPGAKVRSAFVGATLAAPARIGAPQGTVKLTQVQEGPLRPLPFANEIEDRQSSPPMLPTPTATSPRSQQNRWKSCSPRRAGWRVAVPSRCARSRAIGWRRPAGAAQCEGMVDILKPAVVTAPVTAPPPSPADPEPGPLRLHALLRASGEGCPRRLAYHRRPKLRPTGPICTAHTGIGSSARRRVRTGAAGTPRRAPDRNSVDGARRRRRRRHHHRRRSDRIALRSARVAVGRRPDERIREEVAHRLPVRR